MENKPSEQHFGNIHLGSRGGKVSEIDDEHFESCQKITEQLSRVSSLLLLQSQGAMKASSAGLIWRREGGGRAIEVPVAGEWLLF